MSLGGNDFKAVRAPFLRGMGIMAEKSLYNGVGCESRRNGRVVRGVTGISGLQGERSVWCGCTDINGCSLTDLMDYWDAFAFANYIHTNCMSYSLSLMDPGVGLVPEMTSEFVSRLSSSRFLLGKVRN